MPTLGIRSSRYFGVLSALSALAGGLLLSACASQGPTPPWRRRPRPRRDIPPRIRAEEITGRWGLAAYHKDADRPRTEAAARNQCKQPVVISMGPTGGVMMYPPDSSKLEELRMKGAPGNKTYIGTAGEPAGHRIGSRSPVVRRPRDDHALSRSGDQRPLRHVGLCALRAARRDLRHVRLKRRQGGPRVIVTRQSMMPKSAKRSSDNIMLHF